MLGVSVRAVAAGFRFGCGVFDFGGVATRFGCCHVEKLILTVLHSGSQKVPLYGVHHRHETSQTSPESAVRRATIGVILLRGMINTLMIPQKIAMAPF